MQTQQPKIKPANPYHLIDSKPRTVAEQWKEYASVVLPGYPETHTKYREMQEAFYSGFANCIGRSMVGLVTRPWSEDKFCEMMTGWKEECERFLMYDHPVVVIEGGEETKI